jgi:hypothetical protein
MRLRLVFYSLFTICFSLLQAGTGYVYLADTTKLFYAVNNEIYTANGKQLLYFQKGNIFFNGSNDERQNIFLLTTGMNLNSDKLELIYEKDSKTPVYSFSKNKFYAGKTESDDIRDRTELIHVERMKKWLSFYASYNDTLLAYFNADSLPNSTAVMVGYTLIKKYELEKKMQVQQTKLPFEDAEYATLKPVWGNTTANEWIWDGKVLRPRWNVDPRLAWEFDGKTIKPQYGSNIYQQYEWDGEYFKPIWRTNRAEEWSWDGRIFKPVYDTDWSNQYQIENGVVKPWSNVHTEKEWRTDGSIPVPILILVLSGIAKPY